MKIRKRFVIGMTIASSPIWLLFIFGMILDPYNTTAGFALAFAAITVIYLGLLVATHER